MIIIKTKIPKDSILNVVPIKYDYTDSYSRALTDENNQLNSLDVGKAFLIFSPKWMKFMVFIRNTFASVLRLKQGKPRIPKEQLKDFKCEPGERFGILRVFDRTKNEVIYGEDDKHLNFRISLLLSAYPGHGFSKKLTITTVVVFNNWLGHVYFFFVRPFHKLIVKAMLKKYPALLKLNQ